MAHPPAIEAATPHRGTGARRPRHHVLRQFGFRGRRDRGEVRPPVSPQPGPTRSGRRSSAGKWPTTERLWARCRSLSCRSSRSRSAPCFPACAACRTRSAISATAGPHASCRACRRSSRSSPRKAPETIAALFAEPVQNGRGALVPPDGYWQELRAHLRQVRHPARLRRGHLLVRPARPLVRPRADGRRA